MFKNIKRIACTALAIVGVCSSVATFTACETPHPEVKLTLSFNNKDYNLEYVLYRNVTPATVNHFLALAENDYYDGFCVHDYQSEKWVTGAYKFENEKLAYQDYFDTVASFIPQTVWQDSEKKMPTYTLYGEFENNNFSVENGAISESFGSLVMYYSDKDTEGEVYVQRNKDGKLAPRAYEENSATSQFYISLKTTTAKNNDYCVFATLKDGSKAVLESLQAAIDSYINSTYGEDEEDEFVTETELDIDDDHDALGGNGSLATFDVPNEPITVKDVKVLKY